MDRRATKLALGCASLALAAGACLPPDGARGDVASDAGGGAGGSSGSGGGGGAGGAGGAGGSAPTHTVRWAKRFGDGADQTISAVAVDGMDHILITGQGAGTLDLDGVTLTGDGGAPYAYVAALDGSGHALWARRIAGGYVNTTAIAVGPSGAIAVGGHFMDTIDVDGLGKPVTSAGKHDAFVAKLAGYGAPMWLRRWGDAEDAQLVTGVGFDGAGDVYVAGQFAGTLTFEKPRTSVGFVPGGTNTTDVFLAKLDPTGAPIWSRRFGAGGSDGAPRIAVSTTGRVAITGTCAGSVDFGAGSASCGGMFVASLVADGNLVYAHGYSGSTTTHAIGMTPSATVSTAHTFSGGLELGGSTLTASSSTDVALGAFGDQGQPLWSHAIGGPAAQVVRDLALTPGGDTVIAGVMHGSMGFGASELEAVKGDGDAFVARLGQDGGAEWAVAFPSDGSGVNQIADAVAIAPDGDVIVGGELHGTMHVGATKLSSSGANGNADAFLIRLAP